MDHEGPPAGRLLRQRRQEQAGSLGGPEGAGARGALPPRGRQYRRDPGFRRDWGLIYAGLSREESRSFVPERTEKGARREVPSDLIQRLARDYFKDNVHGSSPGFGDSDLKKARLSSTVVERNGDVVSVRLEGEMRTENGGFGFDAKMLGRAAYDLRADRMTSCELVAVGTRRGAVYHSGRGPWGETPEDAGPAPMGVACALVERGSSK